MNLQHLILLFRVFVGVIGRWGRLLLFTIVFWLLGHVSMLV